MPQLLSELVVTYSIHIFNIDDIFWQHINKTVINNNVSCHLADTYITIHPSQYMGVIQLKWITLYVVVENDLLNTLTCMVDFPYFST